MKDQNILIQSGVDLSKSIELFGEMAMYDESLGDFMAEIHGKLSEIARFKEEADMPNYAILVHSLKSDAKYFGFTTLAELAYAHELKSKENNIVFVNDNYHELVNEANKIIELVNRYLGSDGSDVQIVAPVSAVPAVSTSAPTLAILVADDSDIIKNYMKKLFANAYLVITASNGVETIAALERETNIAAVLLDLNMPIVDGFKVLEYMKERNLFKQIPVSIITGNDNKEIDQNAFTYPIVDILKKPFTELAIKNIVEKTINFKGN